MALYTLMSDDEWSKISNSFNPNQVRIYNTIRGDGSKNSGNGSDDNFFAKRAKSLENAFGTTGAALVSAIDTANEDRNNEERSKRWNQSMDDIYKSAGYDNMDDYYNAKDEASRNAFNKIGFDYDAHWDNRADADLRGDKETVARLDQEYQDALGRLTGEDADIVNRFENVQNQLKNQASSNASEAKKAAQDWKDYRENSYVGQKVNQDRGKFLGSSINTLSTMFDVLAPGAGSSIAANAIQGGLEGVADELEQNGLENFDWNRAGQNALVGAATGAVTGGLNKGISSNLAKKGGNLFKGGNALTRGLNNLGSSTAAGRIGSTLATGAARGAVSGAVGGATGAGLSAAMNGQDVLGSAIQGAKQGFGQGAMAGGIMAGANMATNAVKNKLAGNPIESANKIQEAETADKTPEQRVMEDEMSLAPAFEPEDKIQTRNKLQSIGDQLKNASKTQKNSALYDSLDGKTAQRAIETGVVDRLESLGVRPENYMETAKTSNYMNEVVDKLAKNSGIKAMVPDLTDRLSLDRMDLLIPDTAAKKYNSYINQIVADGSTPDEYSAGYLLQKSRELGKASEKIKSSRVEGADALSQALRDAKYTLRDIAAESLQNAEITSDLTNSQIKQGLAKLGANQKIQDYYTQTNDGKAPTISDYIRRSSDFEQARDMGAQMEAEKYTRSASKAPTNPMTKMWAASGLDQPTNVVLKNTVAPVASGVTKLAGNIIGGIGDATAKAKGLIGGVLPSVDNNNTPTITTNASYNPATEVYNLIGRTEGLTNAEQARTADYLVNAAQEAEIVPKAPSTGTLESVVSPTTSTNTSVYDSVYGNGSGTAGTVGLNNTTNVQTQSQNGKSYVPTTGDYWTDLLGRAMSAAIDADDVSAFTSLYSMYQDSLANVRKQQSSNTSSSQKLTDKQRQANAAALALDDFSKAEPNFAYDVSDIPIIGGIANIGGNDYASKAEALALQIGYMLSGATVNKEEAKNIGMAYVPQPRDNEAVRQNKLNQIRGIISEYQKTYDS